MFLSPSVRNDVMIIKITVLRNVPCHPVPRPLKHKQVEHAVVDGSAPLDLFAQIEIAKPLCELRN
jgi:hypothetical protein